MMTKKKDKNDKGSIAVLVALSLTMLLGLGAFVVDLGVLYSRRAHLQNAVDSAALAGVQELPEDLSNAQNVAIQYAYQNGLSEIDVSFDKNNMEIAVSADEQVPAFFAKIWGISENTIKASAKAMVVPPVSLRGAVPLCVEDQDFIYGEEYILKSAPGLSAYESAYHSGWFGALELNGPGAREYRTDLAEGYDGFINQGDILEVKHGNMSGPTEWGILNRFARDTRVPRNTFEDHDKDAPEIIYIPIVEILTSEGESIHNVEVLGFAAFFLEGVEGVGNDSIIRGRFLRTLVVHGQAGGKSTDLRLTENNIDNGNFSNYGLYAPKLLN